MKKFLVLGLIALGLSFGIQSYGQRATTMATVAGDTVSTSSALDTVSKVITATAGYSALGIQVQGTKVSGTITAKAYLYGSLDGTTYNLTDSATAFANASGAQCVYFTKTTTPYVYYKVQVRNVGATTSTEVLAVKVYYVLRRHD
jgi:hypothetical protein